MSTLGCTSSLGVPAAQLQPGPPAAALLEPTQLQCQQVSDWQGKIPGSVEAPLCHLQNESCPQGGHREQNSLRKKSVLSGESTCVSSRTRECDFLQSRNVGQPILQLFHLAFYSFSNRLILGEPYKNFGVPLTLVKPGKAMLICGAQHPTLDTLPNKTPWHLMVMDSHHCPGSKQTASAN